MRRLNAKQKKILKDYYEKNNDIVIDYETYDKVLELNDFETINSHIKRYLVDLDCKKINKGDF